MIASMILWAWFGLIGLDGILAMLYLADGKPWMAGVMACSSFACYALYMAGDH